MHLCNPIKSTIFASVIELGRHIEILLLSNDCVIVPGLGSFMAHHVDAQYRKEENLFLPPLRTIGFNPQLIMNDSLLAQSYVECYDMSYPEAVTRIEDEVIELKQHLDNEGMYDFNGIGVLYRMPNGSLNFTPCEAGLLTPSLYGLNSFELKELSAVSKVVTTQEIGSVSSSHTYTPASNTKAHFQKASSSQATKTHQGKTISIRVSLLRNLAAACIAIIAFLCLSDPLATIPHSHIFKSEIDTNLLLHVLPRNITKGNVDIDSIQEVATSNTTLKKQVKVSSKQLKQFYTIVLASHITRSNATAYAKEMREAGFSKAKVLTLPGESIKVIFGQYATKTEAYKQLNLLRGYATFAEGWITKVEI